jgi:hypothetical protein
MASKKEKKLTEAKRPHMSPVTKTKEVLKRIDKGELVKDMSLTMAMHTSTFQIIFKLHE